MNFLSPRMCKQQLVVAFMLASQVLYAAHPLERDCCRRKLEESWEALRLSHDVVGRGTGVTGGVASGIAKILAIPGAQAVGIVAMCGVVAVAGLLDHHAKQLRKKYRQCLNSHIREHEVKLAEERLHQQELEAESAWQQENIRGALAWLREVKSQAGRAEQDMDEIEKQFGWAKWHRARVMGEYRQAWAEKVRLESILPQLQAQTQRVQQQVAHFDFHTNLQDVNTSSTPLSVEVELEIHAPESYASEAEWVYRYYEHCKKTLREEARQTYREDLEQATQRATELTQELEATRNRVQRIQDQVDHHAYELKDIGQKILQYAESYEACKDFWPELGPLKDSVDEERAYFEKARDHVRGQIHPLQQSHDDACTQLRQAEANLTTLQMLRNAMYRAEAQALSMDYTAQRVRAIAHSKVVASELPRLLAEHGAGREEYSVLYAVVKTLVDLAVSLNPATGPPRDVYEAFSGKHLLTGEKLSAFERSIAVFGVLTLGVGSKVFKASDVIFEHLLKEGSTASEAFESGKKAFEIAHETWLKEIDLVHVVKGEFEERAADGVFALKSGMHTVEGFDEFLALSRLSGKTYEIKEVTEFTLERIPEGGPILRKVLLNGVTQLQLPRDSFINGKTYGRTIVSTPDKSRKIYGVKSIWPETYSAEKISKISRELVDRNPDVVSNTITGNIGGVDIVVRVNDFGKITTSYPKWVEWP
ncbi:MAG: pre-toxin TG domain-containing protein [Zetaproteobacteria bacterium]|nr:pre-toxin TG domain-containing protein [Zetaproteobacteria bacterium]